jgi:hypothetical protein
MFLCRSIHVDYMYITVETDTDTNTDTDRKRHASWVMGHASGVIGTAFRQGGAIMLHKIYQELGSMPTLVLP